MMKRILFLVGSAVAAAAWAAAEDYPLEFKTLTADEAMRLPGGSGSYARLLLDKPSALRKEPLATSRNPLYGELRPEGASAMLFRLDESAEGGYDRLIIDLNGNGDLTDDAVVEPVEAPAARQSKSVGPRSARFGPIRVLDHQKIGDWRPIYFAEMYLFIRDFQVALKQRNPYIGQLRLKAGWYLETTAAVAGLTQKVAVVDGNANLQLGDVWKPHFYTNSGTANWYFRAGDSFLRDDNGSGQFENNVFEDEACAVGPVLYWGTTPCKVSLAENCRSLRIEPWPEPLAELVFEPEGKLVRGVTLVWESPDGSWQLLEPGLRDGKARVPPGDYRLTACVLRSPDGGDDVIGAGSYLSRVSPPVQARAGRSTPFRCGAPLEVQVQAETARRSIKEKPKGSFFGWLFGRSRSVTVDMLQVNAKVSGAAGESYHTYAQGADLRGQPPKPRLTILNAAGKELASGNLEYG